MSDPAFGAVVSGNHRGVSAVGEKVVATLALTPQRDLCRGAQTVGDVGVVRVLDTVDRRVPGHVTVGWLLHGVGAEAERGVQLERTFASWSMGVEDCWNLWCPLTVYSSNNSPHGSSSASPAGELPLLPVLLSPLTTAGPAPLGGVEVLLAAKGSTHVNSKVSVALLHGVCIWFTEAAIGSEQEATVAVTTEQFWLRFRVVVLGVISGGPQAVWGAGVLCCLSQDRLRLHVQGGGVTEQLKPGREEGNIRDVTKRFTFSLL